MPDNYFYNADNEPGHSRRPSHRRSPNKLTEMGAWMEGFFRNSERTALLVLSMIAGSLTGLVLANQATFTSFAEEVDALADYKPDEITYVYADDGKTVIGELALERRIPIEYKDIPQKLKEAILAIEDTRFYEHLGIDPMRIIGAAYQNLVTKRRAQGASTLTQQLARDIFSLGREKTYTRKVKEIMYALQIERVYTKEQIMTLYCNQIFLGGGAYGFEAAANYYFSKHLNQLDLDQYALLAAIPKGPHQFSPIHRARQAKERRNLVLQSMVDAGYIAQGECDEAKAKPIVLNLDDQRGKTDRSPYAYFLEEVRQELQKIMVEKHSSDAMDVYREGLSVYTTLDAEAQQWAVDAVHNGARMYERRHGWRVKFDNVIQKEGASIESYQHPSWIAVPQVGDIITGMIKDVNDRGTQVSFSPYSAIIKAEHTSVLDKSPSKIFKRGDLAQFRVEAVDHQKKSLTVTLDPEPDVQAALILLDVKTGEIKAMVGGYNFATSKFNHATQANRQTGSAFKPFIYAAALEQGLRPDDILDDSPFQRGSWQPHNYDNTFMGAISLRQALALSRNIPAVRLLDEIGVGNAGDLVKRLRLPNAMAPYLPSALGATEEPLLAMVSAYAAFPNSGVRIEPYRIRRVVNRYGVVLDEAEPKSWKALSNYVSAQMVEMMRGVVQGGTAKAAVSQGHPLAAKTGTVDDFTDAWFIGYTPTVACGVWIGYSDRKRSLGKSESGATAALPFWNEFMNKYLKDKPKGKFPPIPDLPEELKPIIAQRAQKHAAELARIAERSGEILPGSSDVPNLDPLSGSKSSQENTTPASNRSAPPPTTDEPAPTVRIENPKILRPPVEAKPTKQEETSPVRKGKKGKADDP
ncbi:MAG: PBP1A family penicillin-binding protein [Acidobacteria bacterium]|nr:PBP1A family penicillin-binding protein [Acidobacteriota bacterium]